MVGQTIRTLQGAGWFPIHALDVQLPYWLGTWLGVFPTWETLGAQVVAFVFVIGSYFAAEYVRITRPRRQAAARRAAEGSAQAGPDQAAEREMSTTSS
jgi:high-affinity iron transporter